MKSEGVVVRRGRSDRENAHYDQTKPRHEFATGIRLNDLQFALVSLALAGGLASRACAVGPIQALVDAAVPGSTIHIPAGTYLDNVDIAKNITLEGAGPGATIVDGNQVGNVFTIEQGATAGLSGMTITSDYAGGPARGQFLSGVVNNGTLRMSRCDVIGNFSFTEFAGGVINFGTLSMQQCGVISNVSFTLGGGIFNSGLLTLTRCVLRGNEGTHGGGICNYFGGIAKLNSCNIDGNKIDTFFLSGTGGGGGIYNFASIELTDCVASRNLAVDGPGGGIYNGGQLTLRRCSVSQNQTEDRGVPIPQSKAGGGIANFGWMSCESTTIDRNAANIDSEVFGFLAINASGGGIYNAPNCQSILVKCTLSGNSVNDSAGGGIFNDGNASLNSCTVSFNKANTMGVVLLAGEGAGVYNRGSFSAKNTIFSDNLADIANPDFAGTLSSLGYNLIEEATGTTITGTTTGNLLGVNPLLGPLQNNGGLTRTHALLQGSPAIDQGINSGFVYDQRTAPFARVVDLPSVPNAADGTDIGAFEYSGK